MFGFFQKEDTEFYDLFVESANFFHKGALVMDEAMRDFSLAEAKVQEINEIEHEADKVNDHIIDKLNQTFITPIDREDIYSIANALDDGVDLIQGTLQHYLLYKAGNPRQGAVQMTKLIIASTEEIIKSFSLLHDIKKNQAAILDSAHKIGELESDGDRVFRQELAQLFEKVKDPIDPIKWKDIMENLEETLNHCEAMSDMLRGVVMKYA